MVGKRHSLDEIASKLEQAHELAEKGKTQKDIARLLGVSVMTFHRWRKMRGERPELVRQVLSHAEPSPRLQPSSAEEADQDRIEQLEIENARLRRLVLDLLLEKAQLEEDLNRSSSGHLDHRNRSI